jgi:surface polysaccharide O-acyltransferase-like enzyme
MQTVSPKYRNLSVETFRLLAMFFVIIPHLQYPNVSREWVSGARLMCRWVLPFFFTISGYYFAEKSAKIKKVDAASVLDRLAWIFIVWILIYMPISIMSDQPDLASFLKMLTSPSFVFLGTIDHLWFISSLFFGYLFVAFCYRNNAEILLAVTSVIGLVLVLLSGSYEIFNLGFKLGFAMPRQWLSVPFLYLGFLFFQKGRPNWWVSLLMIVFGAGLQLVEARFLYDAYGLSAYKHQFLLGSIPFGVGMAGLALSDLKYLQHPLLGKWGSEYSLGIYLIHPLIGYFLSMLVYQYIPDLSVNPVWQASLPVILFTLSLFLLIAIHRYFPAGYNFLLGKRASAKEVA